MSNYFSIGGGIVSSSDSFSSIPTPQMIFTPKSNGYESDSSEEGRKPPPLLGLRVINPDEQETVIEKEEETLVASSSLHTPSEAHWKVYQDNIPQLNQTLIRRESKTATTTEPCETSADILNRVISPTSKYAKISYHLTNDPEGIKTYREMAEKTQDLKTQLSFAKYLLESANAFSPKYQAPVGSMWGISCTTNKSLRPEPFLIVPPPSSSAYSSTSSNKTKSEMTSITKRQSSVRSSGHDSSNEQKRKKLEQEGIDWILKLSKKNVPEACYIQANWMDKELYGFKKNKSKAIALHQIASDAKIPESMFAVADYYEQEKHGMDTTSIIQLYQEATEFGYVNAIYRLALLTIHGNLGLRQSLTEGLKLMFKACTLASPEFNIPPYTFALILTNEYESVDFPSSILEPYGGKDAAIPYYERAAHLGHDEAQSKLGYIYEHGLYGGSINFAIAFDYYEQAAMNNNAKAMLGLCRLYNRGSHGPEDKNEHIRLENDVSGWLANTLANEDESFAWCEKAAKAKEIEAMFLLGWFYEIGFGVPRDFSRAKSYYEMAAQGGSQDAKIRLLNTNRSITKQQHEGIRQVKKKLEKKQNGCRCM